eukprot:377742_1
MANRRNQLNLQNFANAIHSNTIGSQFNYPFPKNAKETVPYIDRVTDHFDLHDTFTPQQQFAILIANEQVPRSIVKAFITHCRTLMEAHNTQHPGARNQRSISYYKTSTEFTEWILTQHTPPRSRIVLAWIESQIHQINRCITISNQDVPPNNHDPQIQQHEVHDLASFKLIIDDIYNKALPEVDRQRMSFDLFNASEGQEKLHFTPKYQRTISGNKRPRNFNNQAYNSPYKRQRYNNRNNRNNNNYRNHDNQQNNEPCRHGGKCRLPNCRYTHPGNKSIGMNKRINKPCKHGLSCKNPKCIYKHIANNPYRNNNNRNNRNNHTNTNNQRPRLPI